MAWMETLRKHLFISRANFLRTFTSSSCRVLLADSVLVRLCAVDKMKVNQTFSIDFLETGTAASADPRKCLSI